MLSQQEISDRFEIQDLCYHYADLVDRKQLDELRHVFAEDAHIDYSAFGGSVGNVEETLAFLKQSIVGELFPNTQHLNANMRISIDGDSASGRIMCLNPMEMKQSDGSTLTFMLGLWYIDQYVRTPDGWRIQRREEEKSWVFNVPDFMNL